MVDGIEKVDKNSALDNEEDNNVLNVKKSDFEVFEALAMDLASNNNTTNASNTSNALSGSPPGWFDLSQPVLLMTWPLPIGSYTQEIPTHYSHVDSSGNQVSTAGPPILPPHLLQVILNNPSVSFGEPTLLPQPNHVMLNHLYALSIKVIII